jgi:hypothetical protein
VRSSPDYKPDFQAAQKTTYSKVTNANGLRDDLTRIDQGKWMKAYQNGYINGAEYS